jgi:hypothetical protein
MIGLGVGIDYALFIVTRYRERLHHGPRPRGRHRHRHRHRRAAVAFAGATVVISLLGMLLMGWLHAGAWPSAPPPWSPSPWSRRSPCCRPCSASPANGSRSPAGVGSSRQASGRRWPCSAWALEFTPLLIGCPLAAGRAARRASPSPPAREVPRRTPPEAPPETVAYRWSRVIQHHPWPAALAGAASCSCSRSRSSACASASPTKATSPRDRPPARPTTCWPRASARLQRPVRPGRRDRRPGTAASSGHRRLARRPRGGLRVAGPIPNAPTSAEAVAVAGRAHHRPRRTRRPTELVDRLRADVSRRDRGHRLDVKVTGSVAMTRRLLRLPRRPDALFFAPCWCCRSCC